MQLFGVVVASPFEISHNGQELKALVERLKLLPGETKVVMEYTGNYYEPIARYLHNEGIYVSVVNAMLLHTTVETPYGKPKRTRRTQYALRNMRLTVGLICRNIFPKMRSANRLSSSIGNIQRCARLKQC